MRSALLFTAVTSPMVVASQGCDVHVEPGGFTVSDFDLDSMDDECPAVGEVPGVYTFLSATAAVQGAADSVLADVREELEALAQGLGLETSSSRTLGELAAQVKVAMLGSLEGKAQTLEIVHEAAFCVLDTDMASAAAAGCDPVADVDALVECVGTCVGTAGATFECAGDAVLQCEVDTPALVCGTDCIGTCASEIADEACAGSCIGTCDGTCTFVELDGSCSGTCLGRCKGMCELVSPGGACDGTCLGDCVTAAESPDCEDTAVPTCVPGLTGVVECSELCRGSVSVPGLVDGCTAPVAALANAATECVPPFSQAHAAFSADVDESEAAALQVWADDVAASMSTMLAAQALAKSLLDSALSPQTGLLPAIDGLTSAAVSTMKDSTCVVEELDGAAAVLRELPAGLEDVVRAVDILDGVLPAGPEDSVQAVDILDKALPGG
jgi:hypothetical protein